MTTTPEPTDLLRRSESYLSAMHGSVARHDNLAANLACAGCELRDQIRAALAEPAAEQPAPADRAALREQIAEALEQADYRMDMRRGDLADAVLAVLPAATDRSAVLREAAEELEVYVGRQSSDAAPEVEGARLAIRELRRIAGQPKPVDAGKCGCYSPSGAYRCTQPEGHLGYHRHVRPDSDEWSSWVTGTAAPVPSRVADEAQQDQTQATPCDQPNPCEDGELCATHEEAQAHAEGEHSFCGVTCEVAMPTEPMRNFIVAKGYPGTAGALAELLRRAAAGLLPASPAPAVVSQPDEEV
ncbi:hypothetical protein ACFYPC_08965 [Streptomyces sp. NPDC005808]|uniref:hypothetical protein n=1 Tax=Streptomyces sp. NPDC005808 TaxID=3364734 RepID=UPI0036B846F1